MVTTTIRIDGRTHEQLVAVSRSTGATFVRPGRAATEALRQARQGPEQFNLALTRVGG